MLMLIMLMLMQSCIDAIDHADSVGGQSAQVDKVEVGWGLTVASQRRQRETISRIFSRWKLWTLFTLCLTAAEAMAWWLEESLWHLVGK